MTAMSESSARSTVGEAAITTSLAMKEWVPPSDIAELVAFLSTGDHRQLTGNTFDINGASYIR
jgi:NAD(P)-dependent dehydrogenase (short-subunit alcohol dehydrogenase family)